MNYGENSRLFGGQSRNIIVPLQNVLGLNRNEIHSGLIKSVSKDRISRKFDTMAQIQ